LISADKLARASEVKAKAGEFYTVKNGDRLWMVALSAYGDNWKYQKIVNANSQLNGRPPAEDGSPLIYQGDRLFVPVLESSPVEGVGFADQQRDVFSVVIDGDSVAVTEGEFSQFFDAGADSLTFTVDPLSLPVRVREKLKPFRYAKVKLYIAGKLRFTGHCYEIESSLVEDKWVKKITAWSRTADLIDSSVKPPYEQSNVTLKQRAETLCADFGISVVGPDQDRKFTKCCCGESDKRFDHLRKLAHDRGLIATCNEFGNLVFTKAAESGDSVATIEQGGTLAQSFSMKTDGRERYSHYRISGKKSTKKDAVTGAKTKSGVTRTIVDGAIPINRYFYRKDSGSDSEDVTDRAEFERSKAVANSLSITVPVTTWYDRNGDVWEANRFVVLKSEALDVPDGVKLLIRRVKIGFSVAGNTASLDLVPKEVFTGEDVPDVWG